MAVEYQGVTVSVGEGVAALLDRVLAWFGLHPQERAFLRHLAEDRLNGFSADAYADFLEENGRDAEGRRVRLLRPREGDVLLCYPGGEYATGWTRLFSELKERFPDNPFVVVPPGIDLRALDPGQMRAAGWVRAEPSPRPSGCARCGHPDLTYDDLSGIDPVWVCRRCGDAVPTPPLPADASPR